MVTSTPISRFASEPSLSRDDVFDVLQNKRRRFAFHHLRQEGDSTVAEMADQVAAWEQGVPQAEVTSEQRQRVYVSLVQSHLPHMADAGVVEFDESTKSAALTHQATQLDVYLEVVSGDDIPWAQYYLGLLGVCTLFVGLGWLGIGPFGTFIEFVGFGMVALFAVSAFLHHRYLKRRALGVSGAPPT